MTATRKTRAAKAADTKTPQEAPQPEAVQQKATHAGMTDQTFQAVRQLLSERPFYLVANLFARLAESVQTANTKGKTTDGAETDVQILVIPLVLWEEISRILSQSEASPTFAAVRGAVTFLSVPQS